MIWKFWAQLILVFYRATVKIDDLHRFEAFLV